MTDIAALEARLAKLEAESAIRKLKARYLNACDTKDVAAIQACFHPDAELDYAPMGKFGLAQLITVFTEIAVESPIIDSHQMHNGEIEILNPDHATGRWNLGFTTYDPRSASFRLMSGIYEDEYIRIGDAWLIMKSRHLPRMIVDGTLMNGTIQMKAVNP